MKYARLLPIVVMVLCGAFAGGCTAYKPLRIEPVQKSKHTVEPRFAESLYRIDRDGNYHFILTNRTKDAATGQPIEQIAIIRMFWVPQGGKTSLNPYSLNASWRYLVMTPTGVGQYEGAGFVRVYDKAGAKKMRARIVDGDLRVTESSEKFVDALGRAVFSGNFTTQLSDAQTMDRILQARRDFFLKSFKLAYPEAIDATTLPATPRPGASTTEPHGEPFNLPTPR